LRANLAARRRFGSIAREPLTVVQFPVNLRYTLSRSQRLVPHLGIWGTWWTLFILSVMLFWLYAAIDNALKGNFCGAFGFVGMGFLVFIGLRPMFVGLIDVLFVARREMDVEIQENGAGVIISAERWWLWLDGFTDVRKFRADTWTLQHWNGCVIHIAASAISEDVIDHIRAKMAFGKTREGVLAVVERGRLIQAMRAAERDK
jgi:hypothetical protein